MATPRLHLDRSGSLPLPSLCAALVCFAVLLVACAAPVSTATVIAQSDELSPAERPEPTLVASTRLPQPTAMAAVVGPDPSRIPSGYSPLTGLPVADPTLLRLPALLISIPHFPPQARPQAGLSFAPWVFEYLISSGSTRMLGVFHGQYPTQESPVTGGCEVRLEPFTKEATLLGNRVWLDTSGDGVQDPGEPGVGGVCVTLMDVDGRRVLARTTTDSNGFYGFNVDSAAEYTVAFASGGLAFTQPDVGIEDQDSDADPASGRTSSVVVEDDERGIDAGLLSADAGVPSGTPPVPTGQVGPVRSARLVNIHIHDFFQDSCLVYAGSAREIRDLIPGCAEVFSRGDGGVGAMLDISRMILLAEKNGVNKGSIFNYASNLFSERVPPGGLAAERLDVYFSELDQSGWLYDASVQGWLRYVDDVDAENPGELHADTDRLTGRTLFFENVVVLFVQHEVLAPAIIDMHLEQGESEQALFFRDGQMFRGRWSTRAGEYEQQTGLRRPISFLDEAGNPFPLRPGRTWLIIATPFSELSSAEAGGLRLHVVAPEGAGVY